MFLRILLFCFVFAASGCAAWHTGPPCAGYGCPGFVSSHIITPVRSDLHDQRLGAK